MRKAHLLLGGLILALGLVFLQVLTGGEQPVPDPGIDAPVAAAPEEATGQTTDLDGVPGGPVDEAPADHRVAMTGGELPTAAGPDLGADELEERPEVRGRVLDDVGRPLAGARVIAAGQDGLPMDLDRDANTGWGRRWSTISGTDGRFVLRGPEAGSLRLAVRLGGYAPLDVDDLTLPSGAGADFGDLVVEDTVVLEGRVLVSGGGAVAGAELFPERSGGGFRMAFGSGVPRLPVAVTDAEGRFRIDMMAAGPWKLRVESDGHPSRTFEGRTERPGQRQAGLEFLLEPGATIAGRVTGIPDGGHVGLVVRATAKGGDRFSPFGRSRDTQVAPDGSFIVGGLEEGKTYSLQARIVDEGAPLWSGSVRTRSKPLDALAGQSGLVLPWAGTTGLAFQVVDASGAPVEDLRVAHGAGFRRQHRVDGEQVEHYPGGRVLLQDLSRPAWSDEPYTVELRAVGFEVLEREVELETGLVQDLGVLSLEPVPVLAVHVLDDATGLPVEDAKVTLSLVGPEPSTAFPAGAFLSPAMEDDAARTHHGESDGEGMALVTSFPGETARLRVEHPDHVPYELASLTLPAAGGGDQEVRLGKGGAVLVSVLDAFGEPAPGVRVEERTPPSTSPPSAEGAIMVTSMTFGGPGGDEAVTDDQGRLTFEHLTPGPHEFRLAPSTGGGPVIAWGGMERGKPEDWTPVDVAEGATVELVLHQQPMASLVGRVLEAGEPLAGATLSLRSSDAGGPDLGGLVIPGLGLPNSSKTDGRGNFRIEGVEPGSYTLSVSHPSRVMSTPYDQELVAGENRRDLDLPVAIIEGRVTGPDGAALQGIDVGVHRVTGTTTQRFQAMMFMGDDGGASITVGDQAADPTVTDADGRYTLRGVETGVQLVVEAKGEGEGVAPAESPPLELEPGELLGGVDLVLAAAGSIAIEVVEHEDGSFWMITIERVLEDGATEPATTGFASEGKETFGGLTPGSYRVRCEGLDSTGGAEREPVDVEVRAGETTPARILP